MEEEAENIGTVDNTAPQESLPGESPKWWIDEGVPGIGDRPLWLPEKFKNIKEVFSIMDGIEELRDHEPEEDEMHPFDRHGFKPFERGIEGMDARLILFIQ